MDDNERRRQRHFERDNPRRQTEAQRHQAVVEERRASVAPSSNKVRMKYFFSEGSGDSVRDPMIMWMTKPPKTREDRQRLVDAMREVAFVTKQRYIWIRANDHNTTRVPSHDGKERVRVKTFPHVTIYTSEERWYYELEGHAYVVYDKETGELAGLASESELKSFYRGMNPKMFIYGTQKSQSFRRPDSTGLRWVSR